MIFLLAALIGLALGPVVFAALHRAPFTQLALDGFVLVAVVGLVGFHILPEAFEVNGWWAILAASAGLLLPLGVERLRALSSNASHGVVLGIACIALLIHASVDGVGLAAADGSTALAVAVVLHRLPVGLAVWWLVRPQFGRGWALAALAALGVATVGGFALQEAFFAAEGEAVQLVQAFVAGSLLHVLLHQSVGFHDHDTEETGWRIPGTLGALGGFALVLLLPGLEEATFGQRLFDVSLAAAPVLMVLLAGGLLLLSFRKSGDESFGHRALDILDHSLPWAMLALVAAALLGESLDVTATAANVTATVTLAALVVVSLAHQGPRDFVLIVLPLGGLAHDHDHDHHHHSTEPDSVPAGVALEG